MKFRINLLIVIGMYLIIYNPPLLKFNFILVIGPLSVLYLLCNRKQLREYMNLKPVIITECILAVMLGYLMLIAVLNHNPVTIFAYLVYWIAGDIPFALAVWISLRKRGQDFDDLLDHVLIAGLIMAATAILAFLVPPVKAFFTDRMRDYGIPLTDLHAGFRNFGLAANMTSTASFVQAVLASVALYRGIRGKKWIWLAMFPVLAFSANLNTRASLVFILAGMAAVMATILYTRDWKKAGIYAAFAVVCIVIAHFGLQLIKYMNPRSFEWYSNGVNQLQAFAANGEASDGYFGMLAEMTNVNVFPKGIKMIFGAGMTIAAGTEEGIHSDVGFINDLWRGGLIYSLAVMGCFAWMLVRILRNRRIAREDGIFFAALFLMTFVPNNIKGSFFIHSDVTTVIWILYAAMDWTKTKGEILIWNKSL